MLLSRSFVMLRTQYLGLKLVGNRFVSKSMPLNVILLRVPTNSMWIKLSWCTRNLALGFWGCSDQRSGAFLDLSTLSVDTRRLLDTSLQKSFRDFSMRVFDHFCANGMVFRASISEHCDVEITMAGKKVRRLAELLSNSWTMLIVWKSSVLVIIPPGSVPRMVAVVVMLLAAPVHQVSVGLLVTF